MGGLDFDEMVFDHVRRALGEQWARVDPADPAVRPALARLRRECTLAKEALSADTDVQIPVILPGIDTRVRLARAEFEEMIRPTVEETAAMLYRAIDSAGSLPEDVSAVLLTGGSARIPLVTQVVSEILGRPVIVAPNPKGDTAIGAALAIGGLAAEEAEASVPPETTRIALRAVPAPASSPVRPPVPAGLAAPTGAKRGRFGLSRTLAATAAAATALLVGGGVVLASHYGPSGAGAEPKAPTTTSSSATEVTTTTTPATTKKKPTPRRTEDPRQTQAETEQPRTEEPTTSEPTETTTTPPTDTTTTTETTTTTTTTTPEEPPADDDADPGQANRSQS